MNRPELNSQIAVHDFKEFYWLKKELIDFCKTQSIDYSGGKQDITERIIIFLEKGIVKPKKSKPAQSKFNWNNAPLELNTSITDNFKFSANVRSFFIKQIGSHFKVNIDFIQWTKDNIGQTLQKAIEEWEKIEQTKKDKNYKSSIAPQFEYNRYIRAFLEDNPDKTAQDAIRFWKIKKMMRGTNEYEKSDLQLLK